MNAPPRSRVRALFKDDDSDRTTGVDESPPDLHIRKVRVAQMARIAVLGPLRISGLQPRITPKDRVVLEALTIRVGENVTVDWLADALWGEAPPASANKNLQSCIARLRKELGRDAIETTASGYRLALPPTDVDSHAFELLVQRGRELLTLREPDRAAYVVADALAMFQGEPLEDLSGWEVGVLEVERLRELRWGAEELRVDALLAAGQHHDVLTQARALVTDQPLRERRHVQLALAQYRSGEQVEALATLRGLRELLLDELGVDPGPEATALEHAVLLQDADLMIAATSGQGTICPWPGLTSYDVEDRESFCGRDTETAACLRLLHGRGVLAVVGPSGSGKSSLLRAGIAATLRAGGREVRVMSPGRAGPSEVDAVVRTPIRTVLFVDQLEEVFAPGVTPEHRSAYLEALSRRGGGGELVVALRADRTPELSGEPELARLLERGWYLLSAIDAAGLRTAIERPARQAGLLVEPGLVDLLLREVQDEPGALPLLSHSLVETWNRREGRTLTVDGYLATGGVRGSIAQSAEAVYDEIPLEQRDQLRDLLMRLVAPGAEGEPTRIRIARDRVVTRPEQERLVELLVGSRLLTSDDGNITLAHEALAREWPRLRGWLDDDIEGQRIRHHLSAAADAWEALGRPDSELYRGVRLARATEWSAGPGAALTEGEQQFLEASTHLAEAEQQSIAERARAQARLIRRLRISLGGAAVLLVVALAAGGTAVVQSNRADRKATEAGEAAEAARQAAVSADARRVGARSQLTDDNSLSLMLAVAGARLDDSPETRMSLLTALMRRPQLVRSVAAEGGYMEVFDVSRDGRWIASSDAQNRMHLYDAATNRLVRSYDAGRPPGDEQVWIEGEFSPDSRQLAVILTRGEHEPVHLLDPNTMRPTRTLSRPRGERAFAIDLGYSGDGRYLAATMVTEDPALNFTPKGIPAYALVWDLGSSASVPVRLETHPGFQSMALSPDGQILYTASPLTAYDVATGGTTWDRPNLTYGTLDLNRKGTLLAEGSETDVFLVDAASGETVRRLRGHRAAVRDLRFSPDGTLVGSVADDGELIVWDTRSGHVLARWDTSDQWGVGFSPDNRLVYYGGGIDAMLRTWDLSSQDTYLRQTTRVGGAEVFHHADFSPDGQRVAYSWRDPKSGGWVRFVDAVTGDATPATRVPAARSAWASGAWHPQGGQYAAYCDDLSCPAHHLGTVTVLDTVTGRPVLGERDVVEGEEAVYSLAYVDQGRHLLLGDTAGTHVLDAGTLQPRGGSFDALAHCCTAPLGDGSTAMIPEYSNDGASIHWRVIDVDTGEVGREGDVNLGGLPYASAASPDGSVVAIAGQAGEIVSIDVLTGDHRRSTGLGATVRWLNYSDDGELLVSGATDGEVSLWDATTLDLLGTVHPLHRGEPVPAGAQFIGDSHDVAIASYDGRVYRWETDLDRAVEFACAMAGRDLTEDEWADYLPAQPYQSICPDG
jgi:WD40 repeat protein/DNA-binding SARP family transcriptional activator